MTEPSRPRVLFLGVTYAGHATRFANLQANLRGNPDIDARFRSITGWKDGGFIERTAFLPRGVRGRMRAVAEASPFASFPRPDAIWLSAPEVVLPYLWSQLGRLRRPVILDLDATRAQLDRMSEWYFDRPPRAGFRSRFEQANEHLLRRYTVLYTPWSNWAASGLREEGIPSDRIRVIPPGVDLAAWQPVAGRAASGVPLRLLFVGGNFVRKGGDMLLEVMRSPLGASLEADIVTRDPVPQTANVRVHRAEPNSPELRELYARADLFVLPTRAECFGIAAVEAMASGLPVVMGNVGGAADIVDHGVNGWLIEPTTNDLTAALASAVADPARLITMAAASRRLAESRFDGRKNDLQVAEAIVGLHDARTTRGQKGPEALNARAG